MVVALTGGIGSGKSTIAKVLEIMGCVIYNSDEKAKELYYNIEIKKQVVELLGNKTYNDEGELNKDYISKIIFNDVNLLDKINKIIHPALNIDFENFTKKYSVDTIIIKESALIFETNLYLNFKNIILVTASVDEKIKRIVKRNSISEVEVKKRMATQWTDEQKKPFANFIIKNNYNDAVIPQILSVLNALCRMNK